jgi:hypothetical protein
LRKGKYLAMATISWIGGTGSSFNTAADWSTDTVPGVGDTALINLAGSYTVNSNQSNTIASLAIISTATLDSTSGTFSITNGTGTGGIAGTLIVGNNTDLDLGGSFVSSGTINQQAGANTTAIILTTTQVTLSGGGHLNLSSNGVIYGSSSTYTLNITHYTVDGSGNVGDGQMTLAVEAAGTIDANQSSAALTVNTGSNVIVDSGLLEATAGAELVIDSQVNAAGGTIEASGAGSIVLLTSTVSGGTFKEVSGGTIETSGGGGQLDGLTSTVTNAGNIVVADNTSFYLEGTINNTGSISLSSTGDNTNLIINSPTVTLTGGGKIVMSNNGANRIYASNGGETLYNVNNTISGAGQLGAAQLTMINAGTINANQTTGLTIDMYNESVNTGLIEDTGSGGLYLDATAIDNAGGTVLAAGSSRFVNLDGGTVQGGTINTTGGGTIVANNGGIDGMSYGGLVNLGSITIADNTSLYMAGSIDNAGTISLNSVTDNTNLIATTYTTTLTGTGKILLGNASNNRFYGSNGSIRLVNVSNTIVGAGQLGVGQMLITNETAGVIDANDALALVVNSNGLIVNQGLMESTGTAALNGGLVLDSSINNTGGTIEASGVQGNVNLNNSMTVEGGTLLTAGGGTIYTNNAGLDGIDEGTLTNKALVQVDDNTSLYISGTIDNLGTIFVNAVSTSDNTNLIASSQTVDLTGGGQVILSNEPTNRIYGSNGSQTLVNVNNTISGAGQLGVGQLIFVNEAGGVVNANQAATRTVSGQLVFNTGGSAFSTNLGLMEATNSGGLVLQSTIINTGGTILASGAGAVVYLNGGTVIAGTLKTAGGGVVDESSSGRLDGFDYGAVTNAGSLAVLDNTSLYIDGTINNTGTISLNSVNDNTNLIIDEATATLTGGGQIVLSNNGANRIYATSASETLVNVNNTISGAGQLGLGQTQFTNSGKIIATDSVAFTINTGNRNFINTASGQVIGQGAGGVLFSGGYVNNQGTVESLNGSLVTYQSGAANVNMAEGQLTGGTWEAVSTGQGSTISLTGGAITTLSATVILTGLGSTLQSGNGSTFTALENSLTTISSSGVLTLNSSRGYTTTLNLTDNGQINLNGGTLHPGLLTVGSTGTVAGFGQDRGGLVNNGKVEALGGDLQVYSSAVGTGVFQIGASSTLELELGASLGANFLSNTGVLLLDKPAGFVNEQIGGLQIGDTVELAATTVASAVISGSTLTVTTSGSTVYTYKVAGALTGNHFAIQQVGSNANLVLTAGANGPLAPALAVGESTMLSELTAVTSPAGGSTPTVTPAGGSASFLPEFVPPHLVGYTHAA